MTILGLCLSLFLASLASARLLHVVDIGHEDKEVSTAAKIAVLTCQVRRIRSGIHSSCFPLVSIQGLMNRAQDGEGGEAEAVFTMKDGWDAEWLNTATEMDPDLEPNPITWYTYLEEVICTLVFLNLITA